MERRRFLRNLGIGAATTFLPFKVLSEVLKSEPVAKWGVTKVPNIANDFEINYATKTIKYIGGLDSYHLGFTPVELYKFLQEEWDTEQGEMPMEKVGYETYYIKELNLMTKHYNDPSVNITKTNIF